MAGYSNQERSLEKMKESSIKKILRQELIDSISNNFRTDKPFSGFTFPGSSFMFEKELINLYNNLRLFGVERDLKTFQESSQLIKKGINIRLLNMTDLKFLKNTVNKYNFMWLDYYGGFNVNIEKSLHNIFERNLMYSNNLLAITLKSGQEHGTKNELLFQSFQFNNMTPYEIRKEKNMVNDERITITYSILNAIANKYGKSITPIKVYDYSDKYLNTQSSNMLLYLLKVNNQIIDFSLDNLEYFDMKKKRFAA